MLPENYIGWGLAVPICLYLVSGVTFARAMKALGYLHQKRTLSACLIATFPGCVLFVLWCVFNIPLCIVYIAAFFCHMLHWYRTQNTWREKLFAINLLHISAMSIHMILIGLCALILGQSMGDVISQPFWRIATISASLSVRILIDLMLPRPKLLSEVTRAQMDNAEKEPFMAFLWFCSIFMCLDSLLCQMDIQWDMLPILIIASMLLAHFFILRYLFHLYSIMKVHHLEERHRALAAELSHQNQQAAELQSKRNIDALTGAFSRQYFMEQMERLLQAGSAFSLIYIDLDRLKQINDEHGHAAGDHYLILFVKTFWDYLREEDIFARLGGDEFAVLLPGCGEEDARARLQAIRSKMAHDEDGGQVISFSFGVTGISGKTRESAASLLRRTDQAMYRDKEQRR